MKNSQKKVFYHKIKIFSILKQDPINSFVPNNKMHLLDEYQKEFSDFTYIPENALKASTDSSFHND